MTSLKSAGASSKGWNWGSYELLENEMEFKVDGERAFGFMYKDIALSSANGKSEVAIEFGEELTKGNTDILAEMRFHVPNNEFQHWQEEQERVKAAMLEARKNGVTDEEEKRGESESEDNNMTAAKLLNQKIHQKFEIPENAGAAITSVHDLSLLNPRSNFSLDFFSDFAKLHGKTHDHKIMYEDIDKIFMLQKPDGIHVVFILLLSQPLRQGMTMHHFIVINLEIEREVSLHINLTPDEITAKYGSAIQPEMQGKLYDILSQLFQKLVGIKKIIVTGEFASCRGTKSIKCAIKAADGLLYPLRSSLVFIHKPVLYIRHSEIKCVEFQRVGKGSSGASRSFDIILTKLRDDTRVTFLSIDQEEMQVLMTYLKHSSIKTNFLDADGTMREIIDTSNAEEGNSQAIDANMDSQESEDESFKDTGSGNGSESDEGMSVIDSGIDKDELRGLA